ELWATPVGTYNDNGQIKEVEGVPVKMSWVSPDALTAHLSKASAKEGEEVTLTLSACQAGTATVAINTGVDRQNRAQTDALAKIKDGSANVTSKTVNLDANGEATLTLVAPKGGLKSTISITSGGKSATEHVTFSTITSPDSSFANRYGFMADVLPLSAGNYLMRPVLSGEFDVSAGEAKTSNVVNQELWVTNLQSWAKNIELCSAGFYTGKTHKSLIAKKGIIASRSLTVSDRHGMYSNLANPLTETFGSKFKWPDLIFMTSTNCAGNGGYACETDRQSEVTPPHFLTYDLQRGGSAQEFWYAHKQNNPNFAWMWIHYGDPHP
ncbi:hypothetical protein K6327_004593, partial [Vibrio vulnificus]|nr:hypothetical protein [Vibrio vulnificus]